MTKVIVCTILSVCLNTVFGDIYVSKINGYSMHFFDRNSAIDGTTVIF